ncbi:hypothetical protein AFCDBAGC_3533 [Methylobacterium cerastii]|uniref:Uncharacterized protein n=1 Tax=Methylobacterium cerastii TaxID=932741 RepID=A0ABQ4QKD2_9HYPH|nr:hypothetical protein AFCDBAGC_3533 [Methylobacterium cerastii]
MPGLHAGPSEKEQELLAPGVGFPSPDAATQRTIIPCWNAIGPKVF